MIEFILNNKDINTDLPSGTTVLDFVRYRQDLKGTKIGCREGDCGACTILVGEMIGDAVNYRTMTSCLMPLANAAGKHIVTIEGINPDDGSLTPVQQAMVDESGTQCGFCTVGFVMSLTGFCIDNVNGTYVGSPHVSKSSLSLTDAAISAIDGNICRCTGYKSIERAARRLSEILSEPPASAGGQVDSLCAPIVPDYFSNIAARLDELSSRVDRQPGRPLTQAVPTPHRDLPLTQAEPTGSYVGGGTDLYVQRPEDMVEAAAQNLFYSEQLRGIRDAGEYIEIGASVTVTDLLQSSVMNEVFPDLYKHLKLVSSTPIRNMATLAGNFVNASPIGDMTVWFLALDAEIILNSPPYKGGVDAASADGVVLSRDIKLRDFYLGYKQLAKTSDEYISAIRFRKPTGDFRFNFEKVCKRTYLDIATVNTAISLTLDALPGPGWLPPVLSEPGAVATGSPDSPEPNDFPALQQVEYTITEAHVAAGGVAPVPLYLKETSAFLIGRPVNAETISAANKIMQAEISPISDVRGTETYKRLLLRQLFTAHFHEIFGQTGL